MSTTAAPALPRFSAAMAAETPETANLSKDSYYRYRQGRLHQATIAFFAARPDLAAILLDDLRQAAQEAQARPSPV